MPNFYINNPKFALATKLCNDSALQTLANAGYYAVDGNYRQWNGASFVSAGLETCDDFASTSLPILTSSSTSSLSFSSEILTSGDANGGTTVTNHGFVIVLGVLSSNPTINGNGVTNIPLGSGSVGDVFTGTKPNLDLNQIYYVRSYATNNIGTNYSEAAQFRTLNSTAGNYCFSTAGALSACTTCESREWALVGANAMNSNGVAARGFAYKTTGGGVTANETSCHADSANSTNFSVFSAKDDLLVEGTQLFQDVEKSIVLDNNSGSYPWFKYNAGASGAISIQINDSGVIIDVYTCS